MNIIATTATGHYSYDAILYTGKYDKNLNVYEHKIKLALDLNRTTCNAFNKATDHQNKYCFACPIRTKCDKTATTAANILFNVPVISEQYPEYFI